MDILGTVLHAAPILKVIHSDSVSVVLHSPLLFLLLSLSPQSDFIVPVDVDYITGDMDGDDEDDWVCTVSEGSRKVLQYEYHVLYSCSYSTPVLYFRASTLG